MMNNIITIKSTQLLNGITLSSTAGELFEIAGLPETDLYDIEWTTDELNDIYVKSILVNDEIVWEDNPNEHVWDEPVENMIEALMGHISDHSSSSLAYSF